MNTSIPSFHDGNLTGIRLDGARAVLNISRVNGEQWEVTIIGVQALRMDEFRQGNIISSLEVLQRVQPPAGVLEHLFPCPHPSAAKSYHDAYSDYLDDKKRLVQAGNAVVLIITPSYGGELVALCSEVVATPMPGGD